MNPEERKALEALDKARAKAKEKQEAAAAKALAATAGKISKALPPAKELLDKDTFAMVPPAMADGLRSDVRFLEDQLVNIGQANPAEVTTRIASLKRWMTITSSILKQLEKA